MKTINKYIFLFLLAILAVSCNSDGDEVVLSGFQEGELKATASEVVLTNDNSGKLVLSFMWNAGELANTYSQKYGLPADALKTTLQFDTQSSFASAKDVVETAGAKSYTGKALNSLALSMGLEIGQPAKLYVRLKSTIAANVDPLYSNVVEVTVTPYEEIAFLYMPGDLSGGWDKYTTRLCSRNGNGEYEGFVNAQQWNNFKFTTEMSSTSGITYGSNKDDLYTLDDSSAQWNIWFEEAGYFLLKANTNTMKWSKTKITAFAVTGEFNAWSLATDVMTYDAVNQVWKVTCNISNTLYGIQIIANNDWNSKYGGSNGEITLGGANIEIATPGTYTITMNLSNPEKYTYTIE